MYRDTQNNSNTLRLMVEIFCYEIFAYLDRTKYNKNNMRFYHAQKHLKNRIVYEYYESQPNSVDFHNLSITKGHTKKFGYMSDYL